MIKRGSLLSSAIPLGPRRDVAPPKKPSPGTRSLTVYAIIEDSGTQIMVRPGDVIEIDPRTDGSEPKGDLVFDRVLSVSNEDGKGGTVGTPYVEGATVAAEIVAEKKGEKQRQNLQSMSAMLELMKAGGLGIWVAPSGGRDRRDVETGEVPVAK